MDHLHGPSFPLLLPFSLLFLQDDFSYADSMIFSLQIFCDISHTRMPLRRKPDGSFRNDDPNYPGDCWCMCKLYNVVLLLHECPSNVYSNSSAAQTSFRKLRKRKPS